jgi:hypothetical protein
MHLVYIDDSRDEELCAFSAIIVPADHQWRESLNGSGAEAVRRTRAKRAEQEAERAEVLRLEINERLREQARRRREQLQRSGLA